MSAIGLKQLLLCYKGTLRNNPNNLVAMGMGDEATFDRTETNVKGNNDEEYLDKVLHKYSWKSFQFSASILANYLAFAKAGGADLQAVGQKVADGVWTGCYDYTGDNFMGLDWELNQNQKDRYFLVTPSTQFEGDVDRAIMQSANSIVPLDLNALGLGHLGVNPALYAAPDKNYLSSPAGLFCNEWEVVDRTYKIKTLNTKKYRDRSSITFINFNFVIIIDRVNAYEVVQYLAQNRANGLTMGERLPDGSYFTFAFGNNLFWRKTELTNKKSEGNIKLTFNRNIALGDLNLNVGANTLTVNATV